MTAGSRDDATGPVRQKLEVPVAHGRLEAIFDDQPAPFSAAVVCHPHPRYGGTMQNNVVYRLARALGRAGAAVLRFNFRGVGRSTGSHGDGVAEEEDVVAAMDFLAGRHPTAPLWVAGVSFGARVGLEVGAREPRVSALLGVGLGILTADFAFLERCAKPRAFIQAEHDEFGGAEHIQAFVGRLPPPFELHVVPGATHLFPGKLDELEGTADAAIAFLRRQPAAGGS